MNAGRPLGRQKEQAEPRQAGRQVPGRDREVSRGMRGPSSSDPVMRTGRWPRESRNPAGGRQAERGRQAVRTEFLPEEQTKVTW